MHELQLITTNDGSHSLYNNHLNTAYHSRFGAITESKLIYINAGLRHYLNSIVNNKTFVSILEMGFGTGLNAVLTYQEAVTHSTPILYDTVEAYPIPISVTSLFNFSDILEIDAKIFRQIHSVEWSIPVVLHPFFTISKYKSRMEDWTSGIQYDIIYYDAFGPETQPELWDVKMMRKMYEFLLSGGVLVTFCAKGSFKRCLREVGFKVESLPGPPGKREITRAIKL